MQRPTHRVWQWFLLTNSIFPPLLEATLRLTHMRVDTTKAFCWSKRDVGCESERRQRVGAQPVFIVFTTTSSGTLRRTELWSTYSQLVQMCNSWRPMSCLSLELCGDLPSFNLWMCKRENHITIWTLWSCYLWTGRTLAPRFLQQINHSVVAREFKIFKDCVGKWLKQDSKTEN